MVCTILIVFALAFADPASSIGAAVASEGPPPILQPLTYQSENGLYQLHVDPSRRDGGGPGTYRMSSEGKLLWEKTFPVTMWDAVVTYDGRVGGYAFSNGFRDRRSEGSLHLVLFDPQGGLVMDEVTKRVPSRQMHTPPTPRCAQLRLSEDELGVRVRVITDENRKKLIWRAYEIETGKRISDTNLPSLPPSGKSYQRTQALPMWTVSQPAPPTPVLLAATKLEKNATVPLIPGEIQPLSPVRDLRAFGFRDNGAIEFVRGRADETVHVALSATGDVDRVQPLPNLRPASGSVTWYPGFQERWFAAVHDFDKPASDRVYSVDTKTGRAHEITFPNQPEIDDLAATPDGGFVILGETGRGSSRAHLISVSSEGLVRWRRDEQRGDYKDPSSLFATNELARSVDGHLVISSSVKDSAQVPSVMTQPAPPRAPPQLELGFEEC